MSKKGARGRWNSVPGINRYSADRKVDSARWVKKRGVWRLKEEQVSEVGYCSRARATVGFRNGARVPQTANQTTKDLISNG
jgi:hypothetical protein